MLRPHADLAGVLEDQAQLGVFLDDRDDAPAHLVGQHRHLDELGVLEPVADDRRVVVRHRDHGQQLGLGPGLEAELVRPAEVEHFLDDLPLLVHLDRVHAEILAFVRVRVDGRLKRVVDVRQPLLQDVAEPDQDRQADAAQLQVIDELLEVDRAIGVLGGVDANVAVRTDGEVVLAPAFDLVELGGVGDRPGIALPPRAGRSAGRTHARIINQITEHTEVLRSAQRLLTLRHPEDRVVHRHVELDRLHLHLALQDAVGEQPDVKRHLDAVHGRGSRENSCSSFSVSTSVVRLASR